MGQKLKSIWHREWGEQMMCWTGVPCKWYSTIIVNGKITAKSKLWAAQILASNEPKKNMWTIALWTEWKRHSHTIEASRKCLKVASTKIYIYNEKWAEKNCKIQIRSNKRIERKEIFLMRDREKVRALKQNTDKSVITLTTAVVT